MTAVDPLPGATRTTCPYCGVGCGVLATPDGSGGAGIEGDREHPANFGRLCSKGSALGETLGLEDRLLYPMIRCSKGTMERVAWTDALDHVAHRFEHIIARDGHDAVRVRDDPCDELLHGAKRLEQRLRGRPAFLLRDDRVHRPVDVPGAGAKRRELLHDRS